MTRLLLPFAVLAVLAATVVSAAETQAPYRDDYTSATLEKRRAERGPWKIENGEARCTQDDELFKKLKNHGPVIWYGVPFTDGVVKFQYQPDAACRTFVFTINAEKGHLFRFTTSERGTGIRAFSLEEGAKHDAVSLGGNGPVLKPGTWTPVVVEFAGTKATVKIGDAYTQTVEHASIGKAKATIGLGFGFGTVAFKDFSVTPK